MNRKLVAIVSVIAVVLLTTTANAITVVPLTFEQLVEESTAIVYARVADVAGRWTADRARIESIVSVDALRYLKGDLGEHVDIRLPGGEAGGLVSVIPGAPVLRSGDLVILFLISRGPSIPTPVGLTQGVFRVTIDARSRGIVVVPPPITAAARGRVVRGAPDRPTPTLDRFAAEVRGILDRR